MVLLFFGRGGDRVDSNKGNRRNPESEWIPGIFGFRRGHASSGLRGPRGKDDRGKRPLSQRGRRGSSIANKKPELPKNEFLPKMSKQLRVAIIGYKFMGKAHSNAWLQAGRFFNVES